MNQQNDAITILLANRSYLYRLLQRIFGGEPQAEILRVATDSHTQEALQLLLQDDEHLFDKHFEVLSEVARAMEIDPEQTIDKLRSEYTYLFIGPNSLPAPPWESVYLTKERVLFQESTLNVRRAYLKYNFLPSNYPHEADDHIGLEMDFMAHLSQLAQEHFEKRSIKDFITVVEDQKAFLQEHLLLWIGDFAEDIQKSKTHNFYPPMADLTKQVLKIDAQLLDELLGL
ncbi:molecular chaperone TorD family protein [Desulfitobacterium sp. THU1]|uniref:TorD/DmsD family molecular chaperone n=1 Tax=Desulfitobacterium sp. THU1 TaxID=3138072 RepID=UPI00312003C1